ncbi:MAG: hypothetical protein LBD76_06475 [Prevotellaceae bacterium]|jgi:hypothetical protein|nr:hypothetical protein [Prevotellaceae bacterium]
MEKDMEKVETIFYHNITEKELDDFFSDPEDPWRTKEGYLRDMLDGEPAYDTIKWHIARLYEDRKDIKKAYKYANKIKDPQYRQDRLNLLGGF